MSPGSPFAVVAVLWIVSLGRRQKLYRELEDRLNRVGGPVHYRVINAGVQGYGPVDEWMYFDKVVAASGARLAVLSS